jgi:hypothetical protein
MMTDVGRVPDGTGLSQAEPVSRLGPSGFDPSRVLDVIIPFLDFPRDARTVMENMGDGEWCRTAASMESETGVPASRVREIHRALRTLGLADFGPICDTDAEAYTPRGSGYWLTGRGFRLITSIDIAEAIATEARRAETPKSGSVYEGAGRQASPNPSPESQA